MSKNCYYNQASLPKYIIDKAVSMRGSEDDILLYEIISKKYLKPSNNTINTIQKGTAKDTQIQSVDKELNEETMCMSEPKVVLASMAPLDVSMIVRGTIEALSQVYRDYNHILDPQKTLIFNEIIKDIYEGNLQVYNGGVYKPDGRRLISLYKYIHRAIDDF